MGRAGTAHMEMKVGGQAPSTSSGDLRYDAKGSELALETRTPKLGSGALRMVVLREAAYLSVPGLVPAGKFVRIDKDDPRFQQLAGTSIQASPQQSVRAFRDGLVKATPQGRGTVDGSPATEYSVVVDTQRALEAQGADVVPGMPRLVTYGVWLDGQDHIRRMSLEINGTGLDVRLSRWDQPVDIAAPPTADLVKAPPGF
jgi:hypothetical protein